MQAALENLQQIRREIRNVRKRARRAEGKESLPQNFKRRVLLVYIYSGYCSQIAADYFSKYRNRAVADAEAFEDAVAEVETLYIELPLDEVVLLETEPLSQCRATDVYAALEYVVQHRLHGWIVHVNSERGVAPSRAMLTARALEFLPDVVPDYFRQRLEHTLQGSARGQRKWLHRFRRRWKCCVDALPVEAEEPVNLEQKARCVWSFVSLSGFSIIPVAARRVETLCCQLSACNRRQACRAVLRAEQWQETL